jgi:hypothetical protein
LTQDEAVLVLPTGKRDRRQWRGLSLPANSTNATNGGHRSQSPMGANEAADSIGGSVLRMKLYDANPAAKVRGVEELPGKANSFIGNDPGKWRNNVPMYAKVKYEEIYSGVDLIFTAISGSWNMTSSWRRALIHMASA